MNKKNRGELLFESYLHSQGLAFEYEPELPGTNNRIDYVLTHSVGRVHLEVKELQVEPPRSSGAWDSYTPITFEMA